MPPKPSPKTDLMRAQREAKYAEAHKNDKPKRKAKETKDDSTKS